MMFFSTRWMCKMRVNDVLYSCTDLRNIKERMYADFQKKNNAVEFLRFKASIEDFLSQCRCKKKDFKLDEFLTGLKGKVT